MKTVIAMRNSLFLLADWMCCHVATAMVCVMSIAKRICRRKIRVVGKPIVLVCANDLFGDSVVRIPFFWTIRKEFPEGKYHVVVSLSAATYGILSKLSCFDEVIVEDVQNCAHPIFWIFGKGGMSKQLAWAFGHDVDVYIVCHRYRNLGSDLVHRLCSPRVSVAYAASDEYRMFPMTYNYQRLDCEGLYSHLLKPKVGRHQIDELNELISLAIKHPVEVCKPSRSDLESMLDFSAAEHLPFAESDFVVLVPGARVEYRRWPIGRFIEVASKIKGNIVVVGSDSENTLAQEIAANADCNVVNLCGKTSLPQLGGILARSRLVITNETGTANLSAVVGARTICILGGGDFGSFFPNPHYANVISVFKRDECFNCDWKCQKKDLSGLALAPCVEAVSVDDVLAAAVV